MTNIQVKISDELIEKVREKLKASPVLPAVYVVDQGLREYLEDGVNHVFFPDCEPCKHGEHHLCLRGAHEPLECKCVEKVKKE